MKKIITLISACILCAFTMADTPNKISFQVVVRNNSFSLVTNTNIGIQTSILYGSSSGPAVYIENQTTSTNANGLATFMIGDGTPTFGTMQAIDWNTGTYFVKTEIDPSGGNSYTITSTSQFASVPYALNSYWTGGGIGGDISNANSGKVGIGIGSPETKLDVGGSLHAAGNGSNNSQGAYLEWNKDGGSGYTYLLNNKGLGFGGIVFGEVDNSSNVTSHMLVNGDGNVGIASSLPSCPLEVGNYINQSTVNGYLLNAFGTSVYSAGSMDISIKASNAVSSINFLAQSDSRIKDVIGQSDTKKDLNLLNSIKVTDYTYKDYIARGNDVQKKLIAQELETILPSAVGKTSGYIPDVYSPASGLKYDNGILTFSLDKAHGLRTGDKIKWIDNDGQMKYSEVSDVCSEKSFQVKYSQPVSKAFIYGREINDFRVVDYDAVTMLNVSSTQELYKMVMNLKTENEKLKAQNESFRSDITKIKAQLGMDLKAEK